MDVRPDVFRQDGIIMNGPAYNFEVAVCLHVLACKFRKLMWRLCTIMIDSIVVLGQKCPAYCSIAMMYSAMH